MAASAGGRGHSTRSALLAAMMAALAVAVGGCFGGGGSGGNGGERLTVYVSVPLHGERAAAGTAIANGVRLALADARGRAGDLKVRAVYLDDTRGGRWSMPQTAANARRAAEDVTAIGYIGDLDSGATRTSLPITNQAEMVQISPGSTAVDLTRIPPVGNLGPDDYQPSDKQSFARVVPDDEVQARTAAGWAHGICCNGIKNVRMLTDGSQFAQVNCLAFDEEARLIPLGVSQNCARRSSPVPPVAAGPAIAYYAGAAPGALRALRGNRLPVLASDALLETPEQPLVSYLTSPFLDPSRLPPQGQRFVRDYRRQFGPPDPAAAYGYESMALLLDAIRRAGDQGDDRGSVIDEVLSTRDRRSVLGTYTIDGNGDTTLDAISGYRVSGGRPIFAAELNAPR